MLTSLQMGGFKAFLEPQLLPIKPLTLIFGANSSGKSSLIHGLLLARHAMDTGELNTFKTEVGGSSVDLGGFAQYVHRRNLENRVHFRFEIDTGDFSKRLADLLTPATKLALELSIGSEVDDLGRVVRDGRPHVVTAALFAGNEEILQLSHRKPRSTAALAEELKRLQALPKEALPREFPFREYRMDRVNLQHAAIRRAVEAVVLSSTTAREASEADLKLADDVLAEVLPRLVVERIRLLPARVVDAASKSSSWPALTPISRGRRVEELRAALRLVLPRILGELLQHAEAALAGAMRQMQYLGPLRSYPPRHLVAVEERDQNWIAGGAYAWDIVRRNEDVRGRVNAWLSSPQRLQTPYRFRVERFISPSQAESILADKLDEEVEATELSDISHDEYDSEAEAKELVERLLKNQDLDHLDELVLIDQRTETAVSHRDVGIGISQVLPVLVHAYADRNQMIAIEQPEIHLHPALQAELGEVFIESALGDNKNTFLLETHSEHLILRILRRVRETTEGKLESGKVPVRPEDISVVFVEPTAKGSVVRLLPVTPDGDFGAPWPGGFFAERLSDLP
ncbi:MAG: hypothetical protein FJ398_04080 [Verrucomicrobia bacterium]|nr:hypothetical protein [Verrucomicrobiota bacterium]